MLGEVRPATRKSPPLFGITCIHCGAEMTGEFIAELIQRWNARAAATASIDKEVMKGAFDKERRDVAERLWKHIGKPLFTGQDIEDIIGVRRSDFNLILADASYRRLADLIEPERPGDLDLQRALLDEVGEAGGLGERFGEGGRIVAGKKGLQDDRGMLRSGAPGGAVGEMRGGPIGEMSPKQIKPRLK